MSTTTITLQQANTTDGSYDPKVSLPKPVTVQAEQPREVYIGHPTNVGPTIGHLVGFVHEPGSDNLHHVTGLPDDPEELVGMFLVIAEPAGFYADTRVIDRILSSERGA